MTNDLSANFPEWWSKRLQRDSVKKDRYRSIASFEEAGQLKIGDTVHRPYGHLLIAKDVGTGGSYQRQDVSTTEQYLTVDQKKEVTFYIEDADIIQSKYPEAKRWSGKASIALGNKIDGAVLGEVTNADSVIANYEIGGGGSASDGIGLTLTTSNIIKVLSLGNRKLDRQNADIDGRWAIISPEFRDTLIQFLGGKESALGDKTGVNGSIGKYLGYDLILSNATYWSARLELATQPTNTNAVVIDGVTFTFVTSIGATPGNVLINGTTGSVTNLVALINTPGTTTANGVALSATKAADGYSPREKIEFCTATDGGTYLGLVAHGRGYLVVSETLAAGADIWTTTKQLQHCIFGQGKPIDLVIQKYPNLGIFHRDGYIGKDFVTWTFYGLKTFNEGKRLLVDVQIRSDAF